MGGIGWGWILSGDWGGLWFEPPPPSCWHPAEQTAEKGFLQTSGSAEAWWQPFKPQNTKLCGTDSRAALCNSLETTEDRITFTTTIEKVLQNRHVPSKMQGSHRGFVGCPKALRRSGLTIKGRLLQSAPPPPSETKTKQNYTGHSAPWRGNTIGYGGGTWAWIPNG